MFVLTLKSIPVSIPLTQEVNWTYIRYLKDVIDVFWTFYLCWVYVLYPRCSVALTLPKDFLKKYKHLRNLGRSHCHLQSWNFQWEIFNENLTNCGNLLYYYDLTFVKNLNVAQFMKEVLGEAGSYKINQLWKIDVLALWYL